ncbi:unnamed protein product, partial [Linum tenue]
MVGGRRKKEESGDDGCFGERRRWEVPRWEEGGRRVGWGWVGFNDVAGRVLFLLGYIRLIRQFCLPH